MKKSSYIYYLQKLDKVLCYNTFSNSFVVLSKDAYNCFSNSLDLFLEQYPTIYQAFLENRFIIEDEFDELTALRYAHNMELFGCKDFFLTILPTMDCNLDCWYCFETHKNSIMNEIIQNRVIAFIQNQYEQKNIHNLHLEFFGGEPLLHFDKVVYPLLVKLKEIVHNYGFELYTSFVTNGSLITQNIADRLSEFSPSFQITLDGDRHRHDKIRHYKKDLSGSYSHIIENMHVLFEKSPKSNFNIRINYDDQTLSNIDNILDDLDNLDKNRFVLHFERVWQTPLKGRNELLIEALNKAYRRGFYTSYLNFKYSRCACKSDRSQQIVVNYDGVLYKCTGRDFTKENSLGALKEDGSIAWKRGILEHRFSKISFDNSSCKSCKMLPLCMGPCSQKMVEGLDISQICLLNSLEMTFDEYISLLFNNEVLRIKKSK